MNMRKPLVQERGYIQDPLKPCFSSFPVGFCEGRAGVYVRTGGDQ